MNPVIEKLAEKHSGSVVFAKVNVDLNSEIATRFHISSLPAYVLFKNAYPAASKIGAASETELEKLITETS
jgi:thioredoxin 1